MDLKTKITQSFQQVHKGFLANPQHVFMIKVLDAIGPEVTYLSIIKAIYEKPTPNSIKHGEKLEAILRMSGMRQGCPLFPLHLNIVLEALAGAIRQEKEIKGIQVHKEVKLSLFADDMILYIREPQNFTRKKSKLSKLSILARYKTDLHMQLY